MKFLMKYRNLTDKQLKDKISRAKEWKSCEIFCDIAAVMLLLSLIFVPFTSLIFFRIYLIVILIPIFILILLPIFKRIEGKNAEIILKENKFKKIKKTNLKEYIILDDKEVSQQIFNQCVESVLIQNVHGETDTRIISFYLINEEVISKVIDTDKELWKTITLK